MDLLDKSLKAKYQVNKNLFVTCHLDIVEASADGFKAHVGIRSPGDTIVPVGTKLYITSPDLLPHQTGPNEFTQYHVAVKGIEIEYGVPVQVCSPIAKEIRTEQRKQERKATQFDVICEAMGDTGFQVMQGSPEGLSLVYQPSKLFIGLVLGSQYTLKAAFKEHEINIPVQVVHLQYDWRNNQHQLGVKILKLAQNEQHILHRLIDPNFKIDIKQNASIDTDEARIRPDSM